MKLYNRGRRFLAQSAIKIMSPGSIGYAYEMAKLFGSSRREVEKERQEKLASLIRYSFVHVPYYKRVFSDIELISDDGEINWDNYDKIPILTKQIIRNEGENLYSDEHKKRGSYVNTSGGSTGEPVCFLQDKEYFKKNFGDKILFGLLDDKKPGDKEIKLWGSERDIKEGTIGLKEKLVNFVYNRELLNSFVMTEDTIKEYIHCINAAKPVQIWAYSDSIYQVAKIIVGSGEACYCPKNIITTAGVLYDDMRNTIQEAFPESRIINQYGSREAGVIGIETLGKKGMHIFEHSVFLEVIDENQLITDQGEGRLLVTNLTNFSMPLIRFDIGDIGEIVDCGDEWEGAYRILKNLQGRTNCHIKLEDGTLVHGEYFTHLFYGKQWIENFQFVQHSFKEFEVRIVVKHCEDQNQNDMDSIVTEIGRVVGECKVDFVFFDQIPKLSSGKYQFVISEVM